MLTRSREHGPKTGRHTLRGEHGGTFYTVRGGESNNEGARRSHARALTANWVRGQCAFLGSAGGEGGLEAASEIRRDLLVELQAVPCLCVAQLASGSQTCAQ